jgi:hypothetical protein
MQRKGIIISIAVYLLLLSLPCGVSAQGQEYRDYTVERGDTMWDITKEELKDPFLWPKVWNANPEINNPDRIYPNQTIKIPLYLLQKELARPAPERAIVQPPASPKPKDKPVTIAKPSRKEYLIDKNMLTVSGYIADAEHAIGRIYDKPGEITSLTKGDYAYIQTDASVKRGEKFYIIYPVEKVTHPVTGKNLGVRIAILGTAEVVDEKDPKILITQSFVEIPVGSLIDTYYEIEPSFAPDNPRKPSVNGYIITTLRRIYAHGDHDIVFIDKGEKDGLEVGDMLATTLQNEHTIFNAVVQVISTRPTTSAAIIRKAAKEVQIGDPVTAVMQE